ncbi:Serine/threonine protein kinase [Stigmatella aurantiaca DW4/3-1]|uniref:Serine/threonine protein kinase n=2 Tax=Stigmatella aurantiaca TaxID=41 RepID=E3FBZ5_STIAD|nr:Serine/threonine protein kinase [Stigmatella aurantiaca DW4/3-1]
MDGQSKSASIPLTSQHEAAREPESGFGWEAKYKRLESLGSGGGAEVFEVIDQRTGEHVALKVSKWSGEDLRRFRREVEILRNLHHENVIPILDDGDNWYTMPLAVGNLTSLAPEMCDEALIEAISQAAKGLAAAYAKEVFHRDVTPNNILRVEQRWVVSDFGLAKRPKGLSGVPTTQGFVGTRGYAAPEVELYGADRADQHSDMFSLGRVVCFITTGKPPQMFHERILVPRIWESLVEKMTAIEISERFQSMNELQPALLEVERRLKEQRRDEWVKKGNASEDLNQQELITLALITQETDHDFRERELCDRLQKHKRGFFNIGLLRLRHRNFIEDHEDDRGERWGLRLTDVARDWLRVNGDRLSPYFVPTVETPPSDDDNIPF